MSAAAACLTDAMRVIASARDALEHGHIQISISDLCTAHRWHSLAVGLHSMTAEKGAPLANEEAVDRALKQLQLDVAAARGTSRARITELTAIVRDGLSVLRDRDAVPLTDIQIRERANGIIALLIGNYDLFELVGNDAQPSTTTTGSSSQVRPSPTRA